MNAGERRVALLGIENSSREKLATQIAEFNLELDVVQARLAHKARDILNGRGCTTLVIDARGGSGPESPSVLIRSVFSGAAVTLGPRVAALIVIDPPSTEDVTRAIGALATAQCTRFKLIVRNDDAEVQLKSALLQLFGPVTETQMAMLAEVGPFDSVASQLRSGALKMPSVPTAVIRIRNLVEQGETGSAVLAEAIELDPAVMTMVLRLAGSATYAGTRRVRNVREAVMRVGANQVQRIAEAALARGCFMSKNPQLSKLMEEAWTHSLARSAIMRFASRFDGPDREERDYLAALLADAGSALLVAEAVKKMPASIQSNEPTPELLDCIAKSHESVGAALLEGWNAPADCVEFARNHHARGDAEALTTRFYFANRVAVDLGYPTPFERIESLPLSEAWRELNILDANDVQRLKRLIAGHVLDMGSGG